MVGFLATKLLNNEINKQRNCIIKVCKSESAFQRGVGLREKVCGVTVGVRGTPLGEVTLKV